MCRQLGRMVLRLSSGLTDRPQKPLASSATVSKSLRFAFTSVTWQLQENAPVPPPAVFLVITELVPKSSGRSV